MKQDIRLAGLASGGGTTFQSILQACNSGSLKRVTPVLLIVDRDSAGAKDKARAEGLDDKDILTLKRQDYDSECAFGAEIIKQCELRKVNLLGQYGWLRFTPANVVTAFEGRSINQHPGPLDPKRGQDYGFGGHGMHGIRVHAARLYFVKETGRDFWTEATAQRVGFGYDEGAILHTRRQPIYRHDDTPKDVQERLLPSEHIVQIEMLDMFACDKVQEIVRAEPLVRKGEEEILYRAREAWKSIPTDQL